MELCKLGSGTFCKVEVPVGKHEYVVHSEVADVLTLEVEPGETYFVSFRLGFGIAVSRPNLSPSDRQTFIELHDKLKDVTGKGID